MRYYLDTNILAFLITGQRDEIHPDVREIIFDYGNRVMTSTVCVQELIHLCQTDKLAFQRGISHTATNEVIGWLDEMGIEVVTANKRHLQCFSELVFFDDHRDPNDRLIIAQAISDRIPLVSSDRKFHKYARYGLDFIYNER